MSVSSSLALTRQFYAWEKRGRGHFVADFPAQLEPPFVPFFGHFVDAPYVDDGRRHTMLSRARAFFMPDHSVTIPETPTDEVVAFADAEENPALTIYVVTLPKGYSCNKDSMEQWLTMLAACGQPISFEIIATASEITIQLACRDKTAPFVQLQLKAYFPECAVQESCGDEVLRLARDLQPVYVLDFGMQEEFMRPMATYGNGQHDPYASLFAILDRLREDEAILLQVLFCGTQNAWSESVMGSVSDERGGSFFADAPEMPSLAREKVSRPLLGATVRLAAFANRLEDAATLLRYGALALVQASTSGCNALLPLGSPEYTVEQRLCDIVLRQSHRLGMLLNTKELATLAHFPDARLSKKLLKNHNTTKQAPTYLHDLPYVLGTNEHQGKSVTVGIDTDQRLRHLHVLGATGTGKSTLLHWFICQDIQSGTGCCVLDPHGDLVDAVLRSIPKKRINDVVLIDPSDGEYPVGFNILSAHSDLERELLASDLVALFKRFSTSWGDQLHSVLANAIMAFLYNARPGHLGDLRRFLIEPTFRAQVLSTCTDDEIAYYWQTEYPLLKTSSIGSILTRLDNFLRPKAIRNMVCQHRGLDFPSLMDSGKIILVKLPQGLIGAENSYLLGACVVAKLQQAAMARQQQAIAHRKPFFCYVDEFHNFVTPTMGSILSGARKYGLGLILAHQDMQQVQRSDADIASSLMSNVGTRVCFRLSDTDAKRMQEGFSAFDAADLQNVGTGEAVARVGTADADFNLSVILAEPQAVDHTDKIVAASRAVYGAAPQAKPPSENVAVPQTDSPPAAPPPYERPTPETAPPPTAHAIPPDEPRPERQKQATREHAYLQAYIKAMAEQRGYKAHTELPTPDGKGRIDVVLEKGNERIAIEVSVSTGVEWELHNIGKCLDGGYSKVVVCSGNQRTLRQIAQKISERLTPSQQAAIQLISPDEISSLLSTEAPQEHTTTVMKGYRVTAKREQSGGNTAEIIRRILGLRKP